MTSDDRAEAQLLNFVGELYDAAGDPSLWQPLAPKLARYLDADSCLMQTADTKTGEVEFLGATANYAPQFWADYRDHYFDQDRWVTGGLARVGHTILGQEVASAEWYAKSDFINRLAASIGVYHIVGAAFSAGGSRLGMMAVHRGKARPDFEEADRTKVDALVPHLMRAMQLTRQFADARLDHQASLEGLERTGTPTIAVDRSGLIFFSNRLAEALLRQGAGLLAVKGRLTATDRSVAVRLAFLIQNVSATAAGIAASAGGGIAIDRGEGRLPLTLLVAPFRPQANGFGAPVPAALIFIRDPETPTLTTQILQDLFRLTPAQAAVAAKLAEGDSQAQVAESLRISLFTVRDHLKVVFAKTGTSHRSQLVALLLRSVAGMAGR